MLRSHALVVRGFLDFPEATRGFRDFQEATRVASAISRKPRVTSWISRKPRVASGICRKPRAWLPGFAGSHARGFRDFQEATRVAFRVVVP